MFFALACAISWLDWGLVIASAHGWVRFKFGANPWGSFGPAFAAVVMIFIASGRAGVKALLKETLRWRFGSAWWLLALFGPLVLVAVSVGLALLLGTPLGTVKALDVAQTVLLFVAILIVGGPLGEEIGWRGYLLPKLLQHMGPVAASLIVAAMWAVWHLPLFWMPGAEQEGTSFAWFVLFVSAFSILTTWIYLRSGGSLLAAIAFHQSINVSTYFLPSLLPNVAASGLFDRIFTAVTVLAAVLAIVAMMREARAARLLQPSLG
jgi:membrane protease YdiL (CAAX protease family)